LPELKIEVFSPVFLKRYMKYLLPLLFAMLTLVDTAHAQIFITTVNRNADKYKLDTLNNTNLIVKDTTKAKTPAGTIQTNATAKPAATKDSLKAKAPVQKGIIAATPLAKDSLKTNAKSPMPVTAVQTSSVAKVVADTGKGSLPPAPANVKMPAIGAPTQFTSAVVSTPKTIAKNNAKNGPPDAEPGKCYKHYTIPDKYDTTEESVLVKPASTPTHTIPATYKTLYDTIVVKPATMRWVKVPDKYGTLEEHIILSAETERTVKGPDPNCRDTNCPQTHIEKVPAVFNKIFRKILTVPAHMDSVPAGAQYKIISRRVIDEPAQTAQVEAPATYRKVIHTTLASKGGTEWREVPCTENLTVARTLAIQKALKAEGYYAAPATGKFGPQTREALDKYQKDRNLPDGGDPNNETLRSLGVE
jgi:hypothetical protein